MPERVFKKTISTVTRYDIPTCVLTAVIIVKGKKLRTTAEALLTLVDPRLENKEAKAICRAINNERGGPGYVVVESQSC